MGDFRQLVLDSKVLESENIGVETLWWISGDSLGVKTVLKPGRSGSGAAVSPLRWQECERGWGWAEVLHNATDLMNTAFAESLCKWRERHLRESSLQALAVRMVAVDGDTVKCGEDGRRWFACFSHFRKCNLSLVFLVMDSRWRAIPPLLCKLTHPCLSVPAL